MAIGVAAALLFGALGLVAWLGWLWLGTPREVRATVGPGARAGVIAIAATGLVANVTGFAMTVTALIQSFDAIASVPASDKARVLAEHISDAMNWTAFGLAALAVSMLVVLAAGFGLLRATARLTS